MKFDIDELVGLSVHFWGVFGRKFSSLVCLLSEDITKATLYTSPSLTWSELEVVRSL